MTTQTLLETLKSGYDVVTGVKDFKSFVSDSANLDRTAAAFALTSSTLGIAYNKSANPNIKALSASIPNSIQNNTLIHLQYSQTLTNDF